VSLTDILEPRIQDAQDKDLLHQWYRRDDNAVEPEYILQPRQGEYADHKRWTDEVETPLIMALRKALAELDWPMQCRMKYATSVTEQEIQAGIFDYPHAHEGAFCFFRASNDKSDNRVDDLKKRLWNHIGIALANAGKIEKRQQIIRVGFLKSYQMDF
jgi:hypothetical protein